MNIETIIEKYNYSNEIADILRKAYPEYINYFGKENEPIIYEALLNTPIVICDNIYDYLKNSDLLGDIGMVNIGDMKRASGVYQSKPNIIWNENTQSFEIASIRRVVAITSLGLKEPNILIHELGHLIKAYYQEYQIEGDILSSRSGLIESKEKIVIEENGTINTRLIEENSVGLEEGLNSILEEVLTKKLYNPEFKITGYGVAKTLAYNFQDKKIEPLILTAQIRNEKEKLITYLNNRFGELFYSRLETILDEAYRLGLNQIAAIFKKEEFDKISQEINKLIIEKYNPMLDEMNEVVDKEEENARNSGSRNS